MLLELKRITIPPGQKILLENVSWQEFEAILDEIGEHRVARIAYENGILEIMTPLPEHEIDKIYISNFIEILLEELDLEFCPLGSTTFKNQLMGKALEPDNCFYIQNESKVRGKKRLDLTVDPPPDLAIEIDISSRTHPSVYETLGVPELWRFERGNLQINVLINSKYVESKNSSIFPGLPLTEVIPQYLDRCKSAGRNKTMRAFRTWVKENIK